MVKYKFRQICIKIWKQKANLSSIPKYFWEKCPRVSVSSGLADFPPNSNFCPLNFVSVVKYYITKFFFKSKTKWGPSFDHSGFDFKEIHCIK